MSSHLVLDSPEVSELAFLARPERVADPYTVRCGDAELACHYHECDPNGYTVVFFHGNGEVVADYVGILPNVFEIIGCNTFLAEYRGYGGSTGTPTLSSLFADCSYIMPAIPTAPERFVFFGRSLGCLQAVEAASLIPTARGLVLESGVSDVYDYVRWLLERMYREPRISPGYPFDARELEDLRSYVEEFCNIRTKLSGFGGHALVTYSAYDTFYHQEEAERLYSHLPGSKRLRSFSNCSHNTMLEANIKFYCEQILQMIRGSF